MLFSPWFMMVLLCTLAGLQPLSAQAQTDHSGMPSMQSQPTMSVSVFRQGTAVDGLSAGQVAASPQQDFTPFSNTKAYHATGTQPVWLRLRVHMPAGTHIPTSDVTPQWTVNFTKPFIDKAVLHTLQTDGHWAQQSAGDWIAHQQWAKKSLSPQFDLPALSPGTQDFYVAVYSLIPLRFDVQLLSTTLANQALQSTLLSTGFVIGMLVFMVLASLMLCATYRNSAYAWYGAYAASVVLVIASFTGLGSYLVWTESTQWPEISIGVCVILACALQLRFCAAMFLNSASPTWLRSALSAVFIANVTSLVAYVVVRNSTLRTVLFTIQPAVFSLLTVAVTARSLIKQRSKIAALWLVAYAPLIVTYSLSVIEHLSYASLPWLPYNAPLYAFVFEMPLLLVALHLHAKTQHSKTVRSTTLAGTDPMTGFVSSRLLPGTMAQLWDEAQSLGHSMAVAYIEVKHNVKHSASRSTPEPARTQERAVRMLRTVAHEQDTVAHVDKDIYALIMPHTPLGDSLNDRLSRLIALGIMTDKDARQETPIRFHIAVSTARSFAGNSKELAAALTDKLAQDDVWGQKSIRFVRKISRSYSALASAAAANETPSNFWLRAAAADIKASTQPTLTLP